MVNVSFWSDIWPSVPRKTVSLGMQLLKLLVTTLTGDREVMSHVQHVVADTLQMMLWINACWLIKLLPHCVTDRSLTYITEGGEVLIDVPHRVVGEGNEGIVCGKGVPPSSKGGLSHPVPEDTQPLSFPPEKNEDDATTTIIFYLLSELKQEIA